MKARVLSLTLALCCAGLLSAAPLRIRAPYLGAISAEASTGTVLFSDNAQAEAYPASITKLMTLLLVMEDVRAGKYTFRTEVTATPEIYQSEPSWVGLKVGEKMSVRDLCYALMVESANDAAIALGVQSAGSLEAFVVRMNARAAALGMTKTKYYNPSGLPPNVKRRYSWKSFNISTAADQLKLALHLLTMPEVIEFTSVKTCDLIKTPTGFRVFVTRRVNDKLREATLKDDEKLVKSMKNHNNIMRMDKYKLINSDGREAVDGLKTGYINAGGSSVVLTGKRGNQRVVTVVLGSKSAKLRDENARRILENALDTLEW